MHRTIVAAAVIALCFLPAAAQRSASYRLTESTVNAGGRPADGRVMTSKHFRVSYDAAGEPVVGWGMAGRAYRMDASFGAAYPPPGEVSRMRFADEVTLRWDPEKSVGVYSVYRDLVRDLPGRRYGDCLRGGVVSPALTDAESPPARHAFFYLVTARNRLTEEGTKGYDSTGRERANDAPCP